MSENKEFKVGDTVNYHSIIGGDITSTDHVIKDLDLKPNNFGEDVAFITGKSGCVSLDSLSIKINEPTITFDPDGCINFPNTAYVESFLGGVGRLCFPDGTFQFAENETYPDVVYSPRLKQAELEKFCLDNLSTYEKYFDANFDAIDKGDEVPPIEKFWLK